MLEDLDARLSQMQISCLLQRFAELRAEHPKDDRPAQLERAMCHALALACCLHPEIAAYHLLEAEERAASGDGRKWHHPREVFIPPWPDLAAVLRACQRLAAADEPLCAVWDQVVAKVKRALEIDEDARRRRERWEARR